MARRKIPTASEQIRRAGIALIRDTNLLQLLRPVLLRSRHRAVSSQRSCTGLQSADSSCLSKRIEVIADDEDEM
jgi:hypothetical protein